MIELFSIGTLCSNNRLGIIGRVTCFPFLLDEKWCVIVEYEHGEFVEWLENLLPVLHI